MKKYLAAFVMMAMMAVMVPLMATDASAQTYRTRTATRYYEEGDKNIYDKHRNIINIGIGAGACGCALSQSRAARCAKPISLSLICSAISRRRQAASL